MGYKKNFCCQYISWWKWIYSFTERKKWVILTLKVESLAELKFDPGLQVIREYLSQIDSILRVKSNWQFKLTLNIESIRLKYSPITQNPGSNFSSASDSTFKVKMTPFFQCYTNIFYVNCSTISIDKCDLRGKKTIGATCLEKVSNSSDVFTRRD